MLRDIDIQIKCDVETFGTEKGAWTICPSRLNPDSVVYSLGIGDHVVFDLGIIHKYGAHVHGFDPTPNSIQWVRQASLPPQFHFHPYGVADKDTMVQIFPPKHSYRHSYSIIERAPANKRLKPVLVQMHRIPTIMGMLGHKHIDILKMDIEGAEYGVIDDMMKCQIYPKQILVEFHHHIRPITAAHTEESIGKLNNCGYRIFWASPRRKEFSFILTKG